MLFSSLPFIFGFLPIILIGFFLLARRSHDLAAKWLGAASLFFLGYWSVLAVSTLVTSILVNYTFARLLIGFPPGDGEQEPLPKKLLLWAALLFNLGLIGYFKYAMFFVANTNALLAQWPNLRLSIREIILPVGISFYTFTQSAFLVGCYRGKAKGFSFSHYLLFVSYFPHLISGPLLDYRQMIPQFAKPEIYHFDEKRFKLALGIFTFGLAKKILLADALGEAVDKLYESIQVHGLNPDALISWEGILRYTFQIYFDFSGYTDMAIGLSLFFGVTLPPNFNCPYQARSIIDYWQRWHMSLTRYIREYVYNPLSLSFSRMGEEKGPLIEIVCSLIIPTMVTFFLVGLWHGAGWTYIVWGVVHGSFLIINHLWNMVSEKWGNHTVSTQTKGLVWTTLPAWGLTFICVCFANVIFRADSMGTAWQLIRGLVGCNGFSSSPIRWSSHPWHWIESIRHLLAAEEISVWSILLLSFSAGISFFLPDSIALLSLENQKTGRPRLYQGISILLGILLALSLLMINKPQKFIYFQF